MRNKEALTKMQDEMKARSPQSKRPMNRDRLEVIAGYGGRCQCPGGCYETTPEFLTIDHVFNDGWTDRILGLKGSNLYRLLIDSVSANVLQLQLLSKTSKLCPRNDSRACSD